MLVSYSCKATVSPVSGTGDFVSMSAVGMDNASLTVNGNCHYLVLYSPLLLTFTFTSSSDLPAPMVDITPAW